MTNKEKLEEAIRILRSISLEEFSGNENSNKEIKNNVDSFKFKENHEIVIFQLLRDIGIPSNVKGYACINLAIKICLEDPEKIYLITKKLYPEIAKKTNASPSRVERAIRHAIEIACERGNVKTHEKIFGYSISSKKGKPTNSEFISGIVEYIKLNTNL